MNLISSGIFFVKDNQFKEHFKVVLIVWFVNGYEG